MTSLALPRAQVRFVTADWRPYVSWVPLGLVLGTQALLSMRLIAGRYVSSDEGRYIYAGHQLIYELWHGGGSPYFETSFSGAPAVYPPLAAMVDHVSGLTGVCLMSLVFMMVATVTLFSVTRRLFGYLAGLLASGLFAGLGITQDLGALGTYQAMALMLIAISAYCAVRSGDGEPHAARWLLGVPAVLLLANATKYMTVILDPPIIALAGLQVSSSGPKRVLRRTFILGIATGALLLLAVALAGGAYVKGILFSTLARSGGTSAVFAANKASVIVIISDSWRWMGATIAISAISLVIAAFIRRDVRSTLVIGLAIFAGMVVIAEGLHLPTVESLRKHDDYAAWFACLAAGSVISHLRAQERRLAIGALATVVAATAVLSGIHYSTMATATPEAGGSRTPLLVASALKPYLELTGGRFLLSGLNGDQILYLDSAPVPWYRYDDDLYIKYPIPGRGGDSHGQARGVVCVELRPGCVYLDGAAGYRAAISAHWFSLISMWGDNGSAQDRQIEAAVERTRGYVLLTTIGGAPTWIYAPAYRQLASR